mgnify:CR=1 FL=1
MKLVAALVSAYLFTGADPQIALNTQYKAYTKVQALMPGQIDKYRDRTLNDKKRMPKSARIFLNKNIDWEIYAESIFRPNWQKLTAKQKHKFIVLLQRNTIKRYGKLFSSDLKFSAIFNGPTEYKMLKGHEFAKVDTTLKSTRSDAEIDVSFIFRMGEDRWALCDVYIEGVSKSRTLRKEIRRIYKKSGYDGVIDVLQKNNS